MRQRKNPRTVAALIVVIRDLGVKSAIGIDGLPLGKIFIREHRVGDTECIGKCVGGNFHQVRELRLLPKPSYYITRRGIVSGNNWSNAANSISLIMGSLKLFPALKISITDCVDEPVSKCGWRDTPLYHVRVRRNLLSALRTIR